jgi:two-component system phosphate regulon sensor histidine kinase PhoR
MIYHVRKNDHGPIHYVRLALPLDTVAGEVGWLRRVVWTATGITLVLALLLSLVIARRIISPLVELAGAAKAVARGNYGQRVRISAAGEVGNLADSFNEMSQACAAHIAQMDQDRQQLRAIFSSMVEGVLVLDAEQNIQFVNEAARNLLGPPLDNAHGRKIWQLFRHRQLGEALEKIMAHREPQRCELEWNFTERKVFAVHGVRLPGELLAGAVLVFHDITHLRMLERVRQDFVANVSHELKTPLAAIRATVETLLDGALGDPDHNVHFLERIQENSDRLYRLVQDLLTLGRIESGQEALEIKPLSVEMAVLACISRQEDRAKSKGLQLQAEPDGQIVAQADEEALAEILDNLVDNAIKYTNSGGRITLRWFAEDGEVVVQVEDTGVGIPEKDLPRIFERFYRVDKARSRELGGTGLGLSIVKHLVQAVGGTIAAASRIGQGTTFTVRLPLAPTEVNEPPIRHGIFTESSQ